MPAEELRKEYEVLKAALKDDLNLQADPDVSEFSELREIFARDFSISTGLPSPSIQKTDFFPFWMKMCETGQLPNITQFSHRYRLQGNSFIIKIQADIGEEISFP